MTLEDTTAEFKKQLEVSLHDLKLINLGLTDDD